MENQWNLGRGEGRIRVAWGEEGHGAGKGFEH